MNDSEIFGGRQVPWMQDLFSLAHRNPIVNAFYQAFFHGQCTFEEALAGMVQALAAQNEKLLKMVAHAEALRPAVLTIPKSMAHVVGDRVYFACPPEVIGEPDQANYANAKGEK